MLELTISGMSMRRIAPVLVSENIAVDRKATRRKAVGKGKRVRVVTRVN